MTRLAATALLLGGVLGAPALAQGVDYESVLFGYDGCVAEGGAQCLAAALEACGRAGVYEGCMDHLAARFAGRIAPAVEAGCAAGLPDAACAARAYAAALEAARLEAAR